MNRPIRKVGVAVAVLFLALFVNLNVVQVLKGNSYRNHAGNARVHYNEYASPRGSIQVQGVDIALSKENSQGELKYTREYPQGSLYSAVTGYYPFDGGPTDIEAYENDILSGDSDRLFTTKLADILTGRGLQGGSVQLTLNAATQKAAYAAMKGSDGQYRPGAVVALDPQTGAILADVSTPAYDPNVLSQHSNLALAEHALGCYQALDFPAQGPHESDAAFVVRTKASIKAQLVLRKGGSTQFLKDYLAAPRSFPLGDVEYGTDDDGTPTAVWTPYLALENIDGAKDITSVQRSTVNRAYAALFRDHNQSEDSSLGQFANGATGCGDVPLDPTSVFAADNTAPSPLLNKALFQRYFAGSIFKIVDSALALQTATSNGADYTPDTSVPAVNGYRPYDSTDTSACPAALNTACVENFDGETCYNGRTATLRYAFAKSCNTAFAQLVVQKLGATRLIEQAEKFGFGSTAQYSNLPPPYSTSTVGDPAQLHSDLGALAQTAFGQRNVQVTPLQAALMSAAVADDGTMMKPYLVKAELRPNLTVLDATTPSQYSQVMSASAARQLQDMMESVITAPEGTGGPAAVTDFGAQVKVGGKTGTADTGATSAAKIQPDAWFTGFAMVRGEPRIAVAVLLEHAGVAGNEATGGLAAGPVAKKVMTAYLKSIGVR